MRIQWKLMFSYLLLILLMGGTLYVYLGRTLELHLENESRENLINEGRLAGLTASQAGGDLHRNAPALAKEIGSAVKARVTLIALDGTVVGDSEVAEKDLRQLENHRDRPEVQQAIREGTGHSIRYSATLSTSMLYVGTRFTDRNGEAAIVRLALPLSSLDRTRASLDRTLAAAITLTVLLSLALSYILSRMASRSLRTMASIAALIGKGDFSRRIPPGGTDELGELAGVMNLMSTQIANQMQRLSSDKSRLDAILRGMGEGLMVIDTRGIITMVNPAFVSLFGLGEEVSDKPLIEITRHPALNETFRRILATGEQTVEELNLPGDRTILTHWVPLLDKDLVGGVVAVFHDISDIKRLEAIRKDFVGNVSHELRTPVTVIKGYAETLLSGELEMSDERARKFVQIIHRHADRLAALIKDLLTLSELESGNLALQLAPTHVSGIIAPAMNLLQPKAEEKGVELRTENFQNLPPVQADRGRLEQVLFNLIENAIKYTPSGSKVMVTARAVGNMVEVSVTDTGIGIPEKDIARLFERFYRVDEARSREQGGTGLGLSIVKHIVQLHGGTVSVTSAPGKGSTFSFSLMQAD